MNEPIEHHMKRIEATGELLTTIPQCSECQVSAVVLSDHPESTLPRALDVIHEPHCPVAAELEAMPAIEVG